MILLTSSPLTWKYHNVETRQYFCNSKISKRYSRWRCGKNKEASFYLINSSCYLNCFVIPETAYQSYFLFWTALPLVRKISFKNTFKGILLEKFNMIQPVSPVLQAGSFLIERSGKPNTKPNNLIVCISCTVLCARRAAHGWFCNSVSLHWNSACFCLTFLPSHECLSFTTKATSLPKFAYNKLQGRSMTQDNDKERITVISCADFCWQSSGERIKWDGMLGTQVLDLMMLFHSGFPPRFPLWASFRSDVQSAFGCEMEICAGCCLS